MGKQSTAARAHNLLAELRSLMDGSRLRAALLAYEETGDHDHGDGRGPFLPGRGCPGGDCEVSRARALLTAMSRRSTGAEPWLGGWQLRRQADTHAEHGLGGDWLRGYVACAVAQAKGESIDDDAALAAWARS